MGLRWTYIQTQQGVKTVSMNIGKCITEKESVKIPQTLNLIFRPIYTDVFKIIKIKTSDICGRRNVAIRENYSYRYITKGD